MGVEHLYLLSYLWLPPPLELAVVSAIYLPPPLELAIVSLIIWLQLLLRSERLSRSVDQPRRRDPLFRQFDLFYAALPRQFAQYGLIMAAVFAVVAILLGLVGPLELVVLSLIIYMWLQLLRGSERLSRSVDQPRRRDPAFRQFELSFAASLRQLAQFALIMAAVFAVVAILLGLLH